MKHMNGLQYGAIALVVLVLVLVAAFLGIYFATRKKKVSPRRPAVVVAVEEVPAAAPAADQGLGFFLEEDKGPPPVVKKEDAMSFAPIEDPSVESPSDMPPLLEDPVALPEDPVVPAPSEDPVVPAPSEDPVVPAPSEDPVVPAPSEDPVPQDDVVVPTPMPQPSKPKPRPPAPKPKPKPKPPAPKPKPKPKPPAPKPAGGTPVTPAASAPPTVDVVRGDPMPVPAIAKGGPWKILKVSKTNISSDGSQVRISLDGNAVGSKSGGYFHAVPRGLPGARSATFTFSVFVPADFPTEKRGGKLPGLCVGIKGGDCATGNQWKDDAGSLRWMFRQGGPGFMQAILYVYMPWSGGSSREKMLNAYNAQGSAYKTVASAGNGSSGHDLFYEPRNPGAAAFKLKTGQWNDMTMTLTLNSAPTVGDGRLSGTVNGVTRNVPGVLFTNNARAKISNIDFVSFAGGSSGEWKLGKSTFFAFKDFRFAAWT